MRGHFRSKSDQGASLQSGETCEQSANQAKPEFWEGKMSGLLKEKTVAQFDMREQRVTNQYNAVRDINFGAVQTSVDLIAALEQLNRQIAQAQQVGVFSEEIATDTQYQVTKAIQQVRKPHPDKKTIVDHLTTAKALLDNIAAASGLVTAVVGAVEVVQKLFS